MDTFGLIGCPLGHSFSKDFFTKKFKEEAIDACYLNFEIAAIKELKELLQQPNLKGFNVTIPYKEAVIPYLFDIDAEAATIGAVNVVKVIHEKEEIKLIGYNSDIIGFQQSIQPLLQPQHTKALILGTGGASKAVSHVLRSLEIVPTFVSRHPKEGELSYEELTHEIIEEHTVIVNCTPLGMHPHIEEMPSIPYDAINSTHLLYDLIYNPSLTQFLQQGIKQGATTKNGLEMLERQALAAWEIWNK